LQLSELVAKKVLKARERAGIVSAGVNGKGKERATNNSGSSDAHAPLTAPHQPDQPQPSNEQPNHVYMMLLVQVIKEMKRDVHSPTQCVYNFIFLFFEIQSIFYNLI
jgi:hypothetical protein